MDARGIEVPQERWPGLPSKTWRGGGDERSGGERCRRLCRAVGVAARERLKSRAAAHKSSDVDSNRGSFVDCRAADADVLNDDPTRVVGRLMRTVRRRVSHELFDECARGRRSNVDFLFSVSDAIRGELIAGGLQQLS